MSDRKFITRRDWILWAAILIAAILIWLGGRRSSAPAAAQIFLDGTLIQTVSLDQDQVFTLASAPGVTFQIQNHQIRFQSSDCPDQICVQTGYLSAPGQYAVCLPHRLTLQIPSDSQAPDAVTGEAPR